MRSIATAAVIAGGLSLGLGQFASAADLPQQPAYRAPAVVMAPVNQWTGCYVGGNLGAGWGSGELTSATGTVSRSGNNSGFAGGAQLGCDYQMGPMVVGIRTLFDWSNRETTGSIQSGAFTGYSATLKNNWMDLLTGRIGYAVQPQWLLYFQGGAAWRQGSLQVFNPTGATVSDNSKTRAGWTIGGGTEWKFATNWSVFLEYNYADFGSRSATFTTPAFVTDTVTAKSNAQLLLIGLNWRPTF